MLQVLGVVFLLIVVYGIVDYYNTKRKEAKGICKTTGGTCTSPTGCTCDSVIEDRH